jgi:hypothetical protein
MDIRQEKKGFIKSRPTDEIKPDIIGDFRDLPKELKDKKFKLIVWDIPHYTQAGATSIFRKKFGCLNTETWPYDVNKGFKELWSVLDDFGVLLLKFSDFHIKFKELLKYIPEKPLFFNRINKNGKSSTLWFCFMKIPNGV